LFAILFEYAMITELKKAVEILREGGIILYPTDTIWGIGCDATNEKAVKRIYEIKQREETKSMLVLLDSSAKLQAYLSDVPEIAWDLIDVADKPLTIIYPQGKNLAANLLSADGTIGIRITQEIFSKRLCEMFRKPIVSTSANVSGNPSPRNFAEISDEIKQKMDYIVDFRQGEEQQSSPSSIIKLQKDGSFVILR